MGAEENARQCFLKLLSFGKFWNFECVCIMLYSILMSLRPLHKNKLEIKITPLIKPQSFPSYPRLKIVHDRYLVPRNIKQFHQQEELLNPWENSLVCECLGEKYSIDLSLHVFTLAGVCGGLCNPSYWEAGIWGWLSPGHCAVLDKMMIPNPH